MKLSGVDEVEDLHHYKSIEDESIVSRVFSSSFKYSLEIFISINMIEAPTAHEFSIPFVLGVPSKNTSITSIHIFRNKTFSCKDKNHHHCKLENTLSDNMLEHSL